MISIKTYYIILICLLTLLIPAIGYTYKDFEIQDLQLNTLDFMQDASYWQLTGLVGNKTSMACNDTYLLGGYGILENVATIKRIYDTPQAHSSVFITFDLWMMNSWTNTNSISIIVSNGVTTFLNQSIFQETFTGEYDWNTVNLRCNETSNVQIVPVRIQTQHTGDKLYFIISSSTGNNQYFGLRNLKITISTQYHYLSSCLAINDGNTSDFADTCPCTSGYYKSSTTTPPSCALCDPSCNQCKGPGRNQCSVCNANYAYNGLQCIECDSSCTTCSGPGQDQCLSCPPDQYLYPSGKCLSYCTAPFTSQVRNGITYCDFPCSQDLFLYQNNSCLGECPSPFKTRIAESAQYCECDSLSTYSVCLSDSDVSFVQAMNTLRTTTQTAAGVTLTISSLVSFGDPAVLIVSSISRMLQCTKYFNISYSTRLQVILNNFNTSILDINTGISTPYILQDQSGYQALPSVFSRYDVQASFIVSYWDGFVCVLILIGSVIFTFVLEQVVYRMTKDKAIYPAARIVRLAVQNFAVIYLYREFGKIVFASLINFVAVNSPAANWSSTGGILSNIIDGILLLAGIIMFSMNIRATYQYQRSKKEKAVKMENNETNNHLLKKYEGVQVLFRDFQDFSWAHQSILLFYILREVLFYLLLTHFSDYPLIQAMWILLLNITMIIHLNISRPFKKHSDTLKQNCFEILLLTTNTLLVFLATLDKFDVESLIAKETLCFFVLAIILGFNFTVLGPLVVQGFVTLKKLYMGWRHKRANMPVIKVWPTDIQPRQIKKKSHREKQSFDALGSDSEIDFRQKDKTYSSPVIISPGETQQLEEIHSIDFSSLLNVKKVVVYSHKRLERKCSIFKGETRENF